MKARFVFSKSKMHEQYKTLREMCDGVSYSVKTNPFLTQFLENETDSQFSLHFRNSISHVKDKSRILFFGQGWNAKEIEELVEDGISSFVADNEKDLDVLIDYINEKKRSINLLLRMRLKEKTVHTERHFVFGMYAKQVNRLIPILRQNANIKKLGIHFHRKTENMSEWSLKEELGEALNKETLKNIDVMNIGGGIPVRYRNHNVDVLPYVFGKIKELREWLGENNVKMIIEPGRFIAAPCIKLEAWIKSVYENNVVINCSIYNSAMDTFEVHTRLLVENELDNGEAYTLKGCTPCSLDVFRYRVRFANPKIGDKIVFLNAGAYTYATDFCGLEKLETVVVN